MYTVKKLLAKFLFALADAVESVGCKTQDFAGWLHQVRRNIKLYEGGAP